MSLNRPLNPYWGSGPRPHRGRFETLQVSVEAEFEKAAERAELFAMCISLIDPTPPSDSCEVQMPYYEVTPGGLSYQDAALQCLMGGCTESLQDISKRASLTARIDQVVSAEIAAQIKEGKPHFLTVVPTTNQREATK